MAMVPSTNISALAANADTVPDADIVASFVDSDADSAAVLSSLDIITSTASVLSLTLSAATSRSPDTATVADSPDSDAAAAAASDASPRTSVLAPLTEADIAPPANAVIVSWACRLTSAADADISPVASTDTSSLLKRAEDPALKSSVEDAAIWTASADSNAFFPDVTSISDEDATSSGPDTSTPRIIFTALQPVNACLTEGDDPNRTADTS